MKNFSFSFIKALPMKGAALTQNPFKKGIPLMNHRLIYLLCGFLLSINSFIFADFAPSITLSKDLSLISPNDYPGQIGVDTEGNAIAIFTYYNGNHSIIKGAKLPKNGLKWEFFNQEISNSSGNALLPQLAVNPDGSAIAVWYRFNGSVFIVQAATLAKGSNTWVPTADLSASTHNSIDPKVVFDPSGNAIAIWIAYIGNDHVIQSAILPKGSSTWTQKGTISPSSGQASDPQLAVGPLGNCVALWEQSIDDTHSKIQGTTLENTSQSFVATSDLTEALKLSYDAQVAIDNLGNTLAVWTEYDSGANLFVIKAASLIKGSSTWGTSAVISVSLQDSITPQIKFDVLGNAIAVWVGGPGDSAIIQGAYLTKNSSTWVAFPDISSPSFFSLEPHLAFDTVGNGIVVWTAATETASVIQGALLKKGAHTWSTPLNVSSQNVFGDFPLVTIDPYGNAVAIWQESANNIQTIQVAQGLGLFGPTPPSNFSGKTIKNKFATQVDLIHLLKWTQSQDTSTTGYRLYQGSTIVKTTASTGPFSLTLHNRKAKREYLYTLVGINADGSESTPLNVQIR